MKRLGETRCDEIRRKENEKKRKKVSSETVWKTNAIIFHHSEKGYESESSSTSCWKPRVSEDAEVSAHSARRNPQ